jgi:hypothetical protein
VSPLLGRKFIVAVITILAAFVLGMFGKLTADFALVASVVNGAFSAADTLITRASLGVGVTLAGRTTEKDK